jgi:type VI secretion system protein ImpA
MGGMASPQILDFEALLKPIAAEKPAGKDIRYDGPHDAIRQARRADDGLAQGEWVREIKAADWPAVIEIATEALATKSKDLQVSSWLTEAMAKRYGFPGLRDGFHLIRELQQRFWDALYPEIEDGDLETRAAPLVWLNEELPLAIRQIPVTQGVSGENYAWLDWKESREVDNLGQEDKAAALADGKITGEQFDKTVESTSLAYYRTLSEDLSQLFLEYEQLDQAVEEKFSQLGRQAPTLRDVKRAIEDCRMLVADIVKKKGGIELEPTPPEPESKAEGFFSSGPLRGREELPSQEGHRQPDPPVHDGQPAGLSLMPQDRADAIRRLASVAEYFRRTEPHSPVAYLVQRAVRWGEMPLEEWLRDVIHDESVLGQLRETLGLKDADDGTSSP